MPMLRAALASLAVLASTTPAWATDAPGGVSVTYKRVAVIEAASPEAVVLDLSVPEDMTFSPLGVAYPDSLTVSVDGGTRFGRLEELIVLGPEGRRPAGPDDVTTLRWSLPMAFEPGEAVEVFYEAMAR